MACIRACCSLLGSAGVIQNVEVHAGSACWLELASACTAGIIAASAAFLPGCVKRSWCQQQLLVAVDMKLG